MQVQQHRRQQPEADVGGGGHESVPNFSRAHTAVGGLCYVYTGKLQTLYPRKSPKKCDEPQWFRVPQLIVSQRINVKKTLAALVLDIHTLGQS